MTRCIAPTDDDGRLCGAPATTTRLIESLVCPLCARHAHEIDEEDETMATTTTYCAPSSLANPSPARVALCAAHSDAPTVHRWIGPALGGTLYEHRRGGTCAECDLLARQIATPSTERPTHVAGSEMHESLTVRLVGSREEVEQARASYEVVREIWRRADTRTPVPGDRLSIWVDVSTPYAMAPKR